MLSVIIWIDHSLHRYVEFPVSQQKANLISCSNNKASMYTYSLVNHCFYFHHLLRHAKHFHSHREPATLPNVKIFSLFEFYNLADISGRTMNMIVIVELYR